jgi:hypothetical protein
MKKIITISLLFLLCIHIAKAQDENPETNETIEDTMFYDPFDHAVFTIGGGVFMPVGDLSQYFGTAPYFELSTAITFKKKKSLGLTIQFVIPNQKDDFLYRRTIDTIQARATMMFNFTADFKKSLASSDKGNLDIKLGVGASVITTDARNPFFSGQDGESKYETVTAILFTPGLEYTHKFSEDAQFVFGLSMHYAPYRVEGAVREDIGGLALVPKIAYIF